MKKIVIALALVGASFAVMAGPRGCPGGGGCRPGPCGPGGGCHPCRPGWGPRPCGPGWGPRPCGPGWGHCPPPPPCHRDWWGRGGRNFWPGFVGGVVGGLVVNSTPSYGSTVVVQQPTVVTQPVVVQQPVVVSQPVVQQTVVAAPQRVWVEGRYVDQVQANGTVVRVWNPGHYE